MFPLWTLIFLSPLWTLIFLVCLAFGIHNPWKWFSETRLKSQKNQDESGPLDQDSRQEPIYRGIGGWLAFFILSLIVFSPIVAIRKLGNEAEKFGLMPSVIVEGVISFLLTCFGIYAGVCLLRIKLDAVRLAKRYLLACSVYALLIGLFAVLGSVFQTNDKSLFGAVGTMYLNFSYVTVWYSYLQNSGRVAATYGGPAAVTVETAPKVVPQEPAIENFAASESGSTNEPLQSQEGRVLGGGMNHKQRSCIVAGVVLILAAGSYPPWICRPGYDWIFSQNHGGCNVSIDVARLSVESFLIVLMIGGLFLIFQDRTRPAPKTNSNSTLTTQRKGRWLFWLTLMLAVLVTCLSFTTYAAVKKMKRLQAGIQNVKGIIYANNPALMGYYLPVDDWRRNWSIQYPGASPFRHWFPCPDEYSARLSCINIIEIQFRDQLLKKITEELDPL
jgi:hypothetical protein